MKKIFLSSEPLEEFQWNFRKDVVYDHIESRKKEQGFTLSLEDTFLETQQGRLEPTQNFNG